ncbi:MAG: prepilin-type N-terminal cleavage/methylation domain-containing protein [Gemmatimonadota bacterium]|nr:prepilin-type N-terminal cleavage/methylation domain-containing protein [Gemmatimonadota bacterium]MDH5758834.1 prepilin-type N-terminal cleavage/methylation domain-containing protein [Gemmatimonadota bacterium]
MSIRGNRGFTLVELIVVTVLGALVVGAALQVLVTNQRTYTAQNAQIQGQQATRAALEVLQAEFRELSPAGGDIVVMGRDSIRIRAMRKLGVSCENMLRGGSERILFLPVGYRLAVGDSILVFADNDEAYFEDDRWISAQVTKVDSMKVCLGAFYAHELIMAGQASRFAADSVHSGAPIRAFTYYTYGLMQLDGDYYLSRRNAAGVLSPLVGPLRPGRGLEFTYLDEFGVVTTDPLKVRQIGVTIRSESKALNSLGEMVSDTIFARIYTRN